MDFKKESELFNKVADFYDKFRPSYPKEIIEFFINKANLSTGSKLLEIGAGSGKATELFVNKNLEILCIDPGEDLVKIGNTRFKDERFRFEVARFEEYTASPNSFDAIFAAQSFHWVPQPVGYKKCTSFLKDGGYLALFWNMYITYDNAADNDLLRISDKHGGFADFLSKEGCEKRIESIISNIENSKLFSKPEVYQVLWKQDYTADNYYGFTLTGNTGIKKTEEEKQEIYKDIKALAAKNNGIIERPYLCVLYLARKL